MPNAQPIVRCGHLSRHPKAPPWAMHVRLPVVYHCCIDDVETIILSVATQVQEDRRKFLLNYVQVTSLLPVQSLPP